MGEGERAEVINLSFRSGDSLGKQKLIRGISPNLVALFFFLFEDVPFWVGRICRDSALPKPGFANG